MKELRTTLLGETADSEASDRAKLEVDRAARGRSTDAEAHRLYLLARHLMDQYNRDATAKAIGYLQQAVDRDPRFALAWTELSVAFIREVGWALVVAEEGHARGRQAVERALALEPALAEAHAQLAWIQIFHDWNWRGAEASLSRARELAPGSAPVIRLSGTLASMLGRPNEAIGIVRTALDHDPLSAAAYHSLGLTMSVVDDFVGAAEAFGKAIDLAPQRIASRAHLALTLLAQTRLDEALAEARREPEDGYRLWALAIIHRALGQESESDQMLRRLIDDHADHWAFQVAEVHAVRGETDTAFEWLERAYLERDVGLAYANTSPRLRTLHRDARWAAFLVKVGLR